MLTSHAGRTHRHRILVFRSCMDVLYTQFPHVCFHAIISIFLMEKWEKKSLWSCHQSAQAQLYSRWKSCSAVYSSIYVFTHCFSSKSWKFKSKWQRGFRISRVLQQVSLCFTWLSVSQHPPARPPCGVSVWIYTITVWLLHNEMSAINQTGLISSIRSRCGWHHGKRVQLWKCCMLLVHPSVKSLSVTDLGRDLLFFYFKEDSMQKRLLEVLLYLLLC